jgi:hypothetical protein
MPKRAELVWRGLWVPLVALLAVLLEGGCHGSDSLERRLKSSIEFEQGGRPQGTWVMQKMSAQVLAALKSATKESLKTAAICSAIIGEEGDKYRLFIFWIADHTTADGVRINFGETTLTNAIPDYRIKDLRVEAKGSVVFSVVLNWDKGSALWPRLDKVREGAQLSVQLLRENKPISNVFRVEFVNVNAEPKEVPRSVLER